nr:cytokinesis protein 3 [Quercus suber]
MSSLHDMSIDSDANEHERNRQQLNSPAPNIWSPDEYELVRNQSHRQHRQQLPEPVDDNHALPVNRVSSSPPFQDAQTKLSDYVQRMEQELGHAQSEDVYTSEDPPQPPLKGAQYTAYRPATSDSQSSQGYSAGYDVRPQQNEPKLQHRKSNFELGRTYTTKTNVTNSTSSSSATNTSNSTQLTSRSIMSGYSAGGFSATSAGSLARHKFGLGSQRGHSRTMSAVDLRESGAFGAANIRNTLASESSGSGPSYHESHASDNFTPTAPTADWAKDSVESSGVFGGLSAPKARRSGFFRKMIDNAKTTARTGAASARSTIGSASSSRPGSRAGSPTKSLFGGNGSGGIVGGTLSRPGSAYGGGPSKDTAAGSGVDWMQVRRDINRSNTISQREREDRMERCEMMERSALNPIDLFNELAEGDEGLDGIPVTDPIDFNTSNLALVDKSTRFIQSIPAMVSASTLAQNYICRPHRTDVQRLRAIFIWIAERITWEEDFEGQIDTKRVLQTRRGCNEEIAVVVRDMCNAVGLHAEVVRGYLKAPGEALALDTIAHPNHFWNAVIVDGEWRVMDCSLASPSNPKRSAYSNAGSQIAESWYFLARPSEICYTHIALLPEQQHIVPPIDHEILVALPCACPSYFRNAVELASFNTSMLHLENLEMAHFFVNVPEDVECVAETEARAFACDVDGDLFESGDMVKKRALTQAEWIGGRKRYRVKALLPGDEGTGTLRIYAGKRGLMHSAKDNPHSLACALPISHVGQNPPYHFLTRHPTPHAQRHDLYVVQPQCSKLVLNNTFVFSVRQHPSFLSRFTPDTWGAGHAGPTRPASPMPYARPTSAMSMRSMTSATASQTGSNYSDPAALAGQPMTAAQEKPAKLAIQTPSQKIIRLTRKQEHSSQPEERDAGLTTSWETVVKIGERGTWRALVLADRSARWCVFAEWECV